MNVPVDIISIGFPPSSALDVILKQKMMSLGKPAQFYNAFDNSSHGGCSNLEKPTLRIQI